MDGWCPLSRIFSELWSLIYGRENVLVREGSDLSTEDRSEKVQCRSGLIVTSGRSGHDSKRRL